MDIDINSPIEAIIARYKTTERQTYDTIDHRAWNYETQGFKMPQATDEFVRASERVAKSPKRLGFMTVIAGFFTKL